MKEFFKFYRWGIHTKSRMALYYAAIIFMKILFDYFVGITQSSNLFLLQAVLVCFLAAFLEGFLFPEEKELEKPALMKRSILWVLMMNLVLGGSSVLFQWFPDRPLWYYITLFVVLELGILAMWIGIHVAEKIDSRRLNEGLHSYRNLPQQKKQ